MDIAMMHSDGLITRAHEGDSAAQNKIIQLWYKRIYNFAYKFFFNHDLAMEVTQRTFIAMHKNFQQLKDVSRFKSWLYTIAVNYCREELRKRKNERLTSMNEFESGNEQSFKWEKSERREENPERQLRHAELSDLLQQCLLELSPEQREVVIMKEYEGLKFREIAEALNVSENTVKSRMYYGLNGLKKILDKKKITKESIGYEI